MIQKQPAQQLYTKMKMDIRDNQLPIAQPLKQEALSERYGVSRIPIRDVLQRLKNEGWLITSGKRGVMVPHLNAGEAEDLYLMRMYLEPLILGHAIPKMTHQIIGKAADILNEIDNQGNKLSMEESGELNWQFHACLYETANRPTLFNTISSLHQQCGRYIGFHSHHLDYLTTSQNEHYQLLEAVKEKQINRAKNLVKAHISDAGELLVAHLLQRLQF